MTLPHRGFLLTSLLCVALASLPFLPGLPGAFVLDDISNIVENPGIRLHSLAPAALFEAAFGAQPGGMTRVLPTLTFALDYFRGNDLDPATFKITNIAVHALTAFLLAWFLRELLGAAGVAPERARWPALAMALAWAVHPLQVASVLYVVQRMQTLATLFMLLALWAYLRARWAQFEGRSGRTGWMLAGLLWVVALACKEDAVLLPAYLLALELTVLRFRAADAGLTRTLQRGYGLAVAIGIAAYCLVIVPHYWAWNAYGGRDFSAPERLLTQGRVLCLYLWQILLPLPAHMPFYYDWLQPSRGLLHPWTTLPALLLLAALLALAWRLRHLRPLFALGVFLFFAGHFVTSNVIGLELAFEHRNHFPLIGVVLAIGDLLAGLSARMPMRPQQRTMAIGLILLTLAGATALRAYSWRSELVQAQTSVRLAPDSVRAWNSLCLAWFELGGGATPRNPYLDNAIPACEHAARLAPNSVPSLLNAIAFKSLRGRDARGDWALFLARLRHGPMSGENVAWVWVMIKMVRAGVPLDEDQVLASIDTLYTRVMFQPTETAAIGFFIFDTTRQPARAYPYFALAVRSSTDPKLATQLIGYLETHDRPGWAAQLRAEVQRKHRSAAILPQTAPPTPR